MEEYKLSKNLLGHNEDVKAVTCLPNGILLSVSRDRKLISWKNNGQGLEYQSHSRFVNSVAYWIDETNQQEFYITGSSDKEIHYWLSTDNKAPFITLKGHNDNVCCLNVLPDGRLVSGSWDRTAIVWDHFQRQFSLEGHEAAVWSVLGLKAAHLIATASADKTIKLWSSSNGKLIRTIQAHSDCVRGLVEFPGIGFLSCANDGLIKAWSLEGDLIRECHGHTSFIYSVAVISDTEFVSCGEDGTVRYWKDFELVQTIKLPCISVWSVTNIPGTTDFAVGSSDPIVRVFSREQERWANPEELKSFEDTVASANAPSNQVGDVNKDDLPDESVLQYPGDKDQEVKMIRNKNNIVEAHQWDASTQQWVKIGEVMNAVNSNSESKANDNKTYYKGQYYDYVFDIDIQDGVPPVKLPYNLGEDPYQTAQKFINDNMLPPVYLEQIVEFILKNTDQSASSSYQNAQSTYVDPYTGNSRYVSGSNNQTSSNQNAASSSKPATSTSTNFSSSNNSLQSQLPDKSIITFKQINSDAVIDKLTQFSGQVSEELQFTPKQLNNLKNGLNGQKIESSSIESLIKAVTSWPLELRFPALDIIRALTLTTNWFDQSSPIAILQQASEIDQLNPNNIKQKDTSIMLAYRAINNLLILKPQGIQSFVQGLDQLTSWIEWTIPHYPLLSGNCQLAFVSLLTNFSILSTDSNLNIHDDTVIQWTLFISEVLKLAHQPPSTQSQHHSEIVYRLLVSIGYLINYHSSVKEIVNLNDPITIFKQIQNIQGLNDKVKKLNDTLLKLF